MQDQNIYVSFSESDSAIQNPDVTFKTETLDNDVSYDRVLDFENSTSRSIEVSLVEDPDSQQLLRYARKSLNRSSPSGNRDEFSVYGEHIANKLRNCGRNRFEVAVAQHEIDNVCFKLTMGAYREQLENVSADFAAGNDDAGSSDGNVSSATTAIVQEQEPARDSL